MESPDIVPVAGISGPSIWKLTVSPLTAPLTMTPVPTSPVTEDPPPLQISVPPEYVPLKVVPLWLSIMVVPLADEQLIPPPLMFVNDSVHVPLTSGTFGPVLSLAQPARVNITALIAARTKIWWRRMVFSGEWVSNVHDDPTMQPAPDCRTRQMMDDVNSMTREECRDRPRQIPIEQDAHAHAKATRCVRLRRERRCTASHGTRQSECDERDLRRERSRMFRPAVQV